ncbi:MAG: hypothetical protein K2X32_09945 [Phycisphaerales bacterium]|nr:hypothetical protein [Phycisphaerales bacterium]
MSKDHPIPTNLTLVHVTHEATEHLGGIGTVISGLLTAPSYRERVARSILVAPLFHAERRVSDPRERLGEHATHVSYSGPDQYDPAGYGAIFKPIEWALGTRIVFGTRRLEAPGHAPAEAEVLLFDVMQPDRQRLAALKWLLWEKYHLDSQRYERHWDFEEYCRLADMAYHTLSVLLHANQQPAVVVAHEYMGMCTALRCALDRKRFRTLFHAHECSTARRIVENLPGYDAAFYPAMRAGAAKGQFVDAVFGSQDDYARHALVSKTHRLDGILAVGPETAEELRFLSPEMKNANIRVAYNGLPAPVVDLARKNRSRAMVLDWLQGVVGYRPDYLITHVTRPVPSKGLWRDLELMAQLSERLHKQGKSCAYVLLTCGAPIRSFEQVSAMAKDHAWPAKHTRGYPDLEGPETKLSAAIDTLNAKLEGRKARAVLVNQFGFTQQRIGPTLSKDATVSDLRVAADVELGMSTYEPYGIAQLEPMYAGAICLPSSVCGCLGLVKRAMGELGLSPEECPVVLPADFTQEADLPEPARRALAEGKDLSPVLNLSAEDRKAIETRVCTRLADELVKRLPTSDAQREKLISVGQKLAQRMNWQTVTTTDFMPMVIDALER